MKSLSACRAMNFRSIDGDHNTVPGNSLNNVGNAASGLTRCGIHVEQDYNVVSNNTIVAPKRHGIELSGAQGCGH
jgi:hypothetical protein